MSAIQSPIYRPTLMHLSSLLKLLMLKPAMLGFFLRSQPLSKIFWHWKIPNQKAESTQREPWIETDSWCDDFTLELDYQWCGIIYDWLWQVLWLDLQKMKMFENGQ